jgi:hypothetical protein
LARNLRENNGKPKGGTPSARSERSHQEGFFPPVGVVDLPSSRQLK